jgi:hypothetical protein
VAGVNPVTGAAAASPARSRPAGPASVAAPRVTAALAVVFLIAVLAQGAFAGGFLSGHHSWLAAHADLGDALILVPLAILIAGLAGRRRRADTRSMLASRVALLVLIVIVIVAGHAGGGWLALHIPAAIAAVGLATRQAVLAFRAARATG